MQYCEITPPISLRPFVACFWILETDENIPQVERIVADGNSELVFHYLGRTQELNEQTGEWISQSQLVFAGQRKKWLQIKPNSKSGMLGVRFTPAGASHFLRCSMQETTDKVLNLSDWSPKRLSLLTEQILGATTRKERIVHMAHFLEKIVESTAPDMLVAKATQIIKATSHNYSHSHLLSALDTTERKLERHFANVVGLSPKRYARTMRFQNSLKALERWPTSSLTNIAVNNGYFDQSHFIREFKSFTELTPTAYMQASHTMNDFLHHSD